MLLSLDPDRMAQLGLTVSDVPAAVQEQNTTNPAGRIGREPAPPGNQLTLPVTTLGRLTDPKEFADIIVRANPDGSLVRVKDIGRVTLGLPELRPGRPGERHSHRRHPALPAARAPTRST